MLGHPANDRWLILQVEFGTSNWFDCAGLFVA
jgi:hypothetical protein